MNLVFVVLYYLRRHLRKKIFKTVDKLCFCFVFLHKERSSRRLGALYGCFPPTRVLFKAEVFYTKSSTDTVYILLSDKCLWGIYRLLISSHAGLNILSSIVTHQYKAK